VGQPPPYPPCFTVIKPISRLRSSFCFPSAALHLTFYLQISSPAFLETIPAFAHAPFSPGEFDSKSALAPFCFCFPGARSITLRTRPVYRSSRLGCYKDSLGLSPPVASPLAFLLACTMSLTGLAPELTDSIIDFLHNDPASLKALSTACRLFLPTCRFHLFSELALESENLRGKNFPSTLTPLVKRVRLSPGSPVAGGFAAHPFFAFGSFTIPPPPLTGPQLRESINNIHSRHVEFKGVKTSTNHALFTAVATSDLKHSTTSLSLNDCCVDTDDLVTLCYALPHVESLHLSTLTFDKSRAMICKIERAAPVPMGFFVPSATSTSDWSSFSESMASRAKTHRLHLKEITIEDTEWTNELCESLVGLVERIDDSIELTIRTQLPALPPRSFENVDGEHPTGQDLIGEQSELFTRFLEVCGTKIDRLDVCLVSPLRV